MSKSNQDRLEKLKQLREAELASEKPSHSYVQDLDQSIIDAECDVKRGAYQMVS